MNLIHSVDPTDPRSKWTLAHSWSKLSITAFLSVSIIICLKFLCSITEQRNGTSVSLFCLSVDRAPFQDQQTAGYFLYCWHRSNAQPTLAAQGSRVIMAAACCTSQGLATGGLLADRQVRPEASPAHRFADPGPPTSAPRWSDASSINTRPFVGPGTAPCLRTNSTE